MTRSSPVRVAGANTANLLTGVSLLMSANLAMAAAPAATQEEEEVVLDTVVVTGSHIRRDEFSSPSPIQVISREGSVLAGLSTTTETLQGSTVSGGGQQINNYFGGFVTDGGPGANTLSLRGLGAVRTLLLVNGRRLAPAGTRGAVGSADLNVLPSAIVDRIEILKDGASSTYGSDAVAGVVNIITKNGVNGFTLEGHRNSTFDGGGNTTSFAISGGRSSDRGQLLGSFEVYDRSNLAIGDRDWASCPTKVLIDPTTGDYAPGTILDPATGEPRCFPITTYTGVQSGIANNYMLSYYYTFDPDVGDFVNQGLRWTPDASSTGPFPGFRNVDAEANRPAADPRQLNDSLISPSRNYTAFLTGSYDTGMLGNAELYFEGAWHRRESQQVGSRQLYLDYHLGPAFENHPFIPQELYDAGGLIAVNPYGNYVLARAFTFWGNDEGSQNVEFGRLVGGMRGALPIGDWSYDLTVITNRSDASYTFESFLEDRIYNTLYVTEVAPGFDGATRVGFDGLTYTCSVNVTAPGSGCIPAPLLDPSLLGGNYSQAYRDYVFTDVTGRTVYKEDTVSAVINGPVVDLPYGRLRAALGFEARWMEIDDTPDPQMQADNLYNLTSAGITRGKDKVHEFFAEVDVPLLAGVTGAQDLTMTASSRYTDYDSAGSDTTYKIGLTYTPVSWLKLRGTRGTSYRAPAVFEQFQAPTSGFLSGGSDPCQFYGDDYEPTDTVYINCAADGLPPTWGANNGVQINGAGGGNLDSEHSTAETVGIILQPALPTGFGDLAFAVDWWRIDIKNQVTQLGSGVARACYSDPDFRAGGNYCNFTHRDENNILIVDDFFTNIARQRAGGLDFNLRYTRDIGVGALTADLRMTLYEEQESQLIPTDPVDDYNGTLLAPKMVGDIDLRYEWKAWTVYYGLSHIGNMDSNAYLGVDPAEDPFDFDAGSYTLHNLAVKYEGANDWDVIVGVRNVTDEAPPVVSPGAYTRIGNSALYSAYDYFGRRGYVTLTKSF